MGSQVHSNHATPDRMAIPPAMIEQRMGRRLRTVYRVARVACDGVYGLARVFNLSDLGMMMSSPLDLCVGDREANANLSLVSDQFVGTVNDNNPQSLADGYALLGARLTLYGRDDRWSVSVFARNLTDTKYRPLSVYQPLGAALGLNNTVFPGSTANRVMASGPRTFGASATFRFWAAATVSKRTDRYGSYRAVPGLVPCRCGPVPPKFPAGSRASALPTGPGTARDRRVDQAGNVDPGAVLHRFRDRVRRIVDLHREERCHRVVIMAHILRKDPHDIIGRPGHCIAHDDVGGGDHDRLELAGLVRCAVPNARDDDELAEIGKPFNVEIGMIVAYISGSFELLDPGRAGGRRQANVRRQPDLAGPPIACQCGKQLEIDRNERRRAHAPHRWRSTIPARAPVWRP